MARDSVSWPDLVRILGEEPARAFCAARGGLPTYVPKSPGPLLLTILDEFSAWSLCKHYGGSEIIPVMGPKRSQTLKERAIVLLESGMTELDVAIALKCHIRTVQGCAQAMRGGKPSRRVDAKNRGVARLPM